MSLSELERVRDDAIARLLSARRDLAKQSKQRFSDILTNQRGKVCRKDEKQLRNYRMCTKVLTIFWFISKRSWLVLVNEWWKREDLKMFLLDALLDHSIQWDVIQNVPHLNIRIRAELLDDVSWIDLERMRGLVYFQLINAVYQLHLVGGALAGFHWREGLMFFDKYGNHLPDYHHKPGTYRSFHGDAFLLNTTFERST
jgi:hypothetical protein